MKWQMGVTSLLLKRKGLSRQKKKEFKAAKKGE